MIASGAASIICADLLPKSGNGLRGESPEELDDFAINPCYLIAHAIDRFITVRQQARLREATGLVIPFVVSVMVHHAVMLRPLIKLMTAKTRKTKKQIFAAP